RAPADRHRSAFALRWPTAELVFVRRRPETLRFTTRSSLMLLHTITNRRRTCQFGRPSDHNCPRKNASPCFGASGSITDGMQAFCEPNRHFADFSELSVFQSGSPPNHALQRIGTAAR